MPSATSLVLLALTASLTLAAPTPSKTHEKHSFKVPVKPRQKLSPAHAIANAHRKYGCDSNLLSDAEQALESFFPSAAPYGYVASSSAAGYGYAASSSLPWWALPSSINWSSAYQQGLPSSFAPAPSFSASAIPSSGFPASASAVPSVMPHPYSSQVPSASAPPSAAPEPSNSASAPPPSPSAPSSNGSGEGEVSADPEDNEQAYISPVSIGGQTLNLDFDTGSADLWVYNTAMSSSQTAGHSVYDPSKSSTFTKYNGASWEIQYGDGSTAQGSVGFDVVNIGGVVASKQAIELAESVTGTFLRDVNSDGLLGLAFSSINTVRPQAQKTFFENVMNQLDQPLFTADLEEDASGTYEFGTIDSSKYTGSIHYAPVNTENGFWQFESNTYSVGGTQHSCTVCSPTIADTGTSLILMDDEVVKAYYAQVQGARYSQTNGGYQYPCSASLPDFGIAVGGDYTAVVKGSDVTYADAGSGECYGGLQSNAGAGINIIGDVFLKQFFAVFDGGNLQFGVATKP